MAEDARYERRRKALIKEGLAKRAAYDKRGDSMTNDVEAVRGRMLKEGLAKRKKYEAAGNTIVLGPAKTKKPR